MPDAKKDRAIDDLARKQHGAFHLRQVVRIGFTRAERRARLASGRWVRLLGSDVLALPSHQGTWLRHCVAATLSVPTGAISGPSAAALHGFEGWPRAGIEVCTRRGTTHRSPFGRVRELRNVGRVVVVDGIRVVSPADCIVQLSAGLDAAALGRLIDAAGRTSRSLLPELRDLYARLARGHRPGMAILGEELARRGDGYVPPTSELNRKLREFLASVAVPPVSFEYSPPWVRPGAQLVDAWIDGWKLIVEADGRAWHTRVRDFERDRERDAVALAHGVATLRLTWHQLVHRMVWCRNTLIAIGNQRVGSGGRCTTVSADTTLWLPASA